MGTIMLLKSFSIRKDPRAYGEKCISETILRAPVAFAAAMLFATPAQALTFDELRGLTYLQIKGSGLANTCPVVEGGSTNMRDLPAGNYTFDKFCMEPTSFKVKEASQFKGGESDFVDTRLMTRLTYTLDDMSGKIRLGGDGKVAFVEEDGIDYAPTTVQLPGGERVPFLFTIKELVAKGRGMTTGYDQAQALAASQTGLDGQAELENEINKVFDVASDTDLGSKTPKKVLSKGIFYGRIEKQ